MYSFFLILITKYIKTITLLQFADISLGKDNMVASIKSTVFDSNDPQVIIYLYYPLSECTKQCNVTHGKPSL